MMNHSIEEREQIGIYVYLAFNFSNINCAERSSMSCKHICENVCDKFLYQLEILFSTCNNFVIVWLYKKVVKCFL